MKSNPWRPIRMRGVLSNSIELLYNLIPPIRPTVTEKYNFCKLKKTAGFAKCIFNRGREEEERYFGFFAQFFLIQTIANLSLFLSLSLFLVVKQTNGFTEKNYIFRQEYLWLGEY